MIEISTDLKRKAVEALIEIRPNFSGSNGNFAKQWGFSNSIWSRMRNGQIDGLINDSIWLNICRELNVSPGETKWKIARTDVFNSIQEEILFCKVNSKAMIFVDECEIGKTTTAKYLSKTLRNCFYIDASQSKTPQLLIKAFAKAIGLDKTGSFNTLKQNIKHYLKMLPEPIVIIDEAGDLTGDSLLELKEFWNATEGACGWYLMGADGLREKINRGIKYQKVGYMELFSRFSSNFSSCVPTGNQDRKAFYRKLITDVLEVNMQNKAQISSVVNKCITNNHEDKIGGLRRAESILILNDIR